MSASLYSYCLRYDDGAAPNPFFGMCTLAICKPALRSTAKPGDWVAGIGSSATGEEFKLVYAMQIDEVLAWPDYDRRAPNDWPHRLPVPGPDLVTARGDCLYDYTKLDATTGLPAQRRGVHTLANRATDLRGQVLIAQRFLYFGASTVDLPAKLSLIRHPQQGHRKAANDRHVEAFVAWYEELEQEWGNGQHGWPHLGAPRGAGGGAGASGACAPSYCAKQADEGDHETT